MLKEEDVDQEFFAFPDRDREPGDEGEEEEKKVESPTAAGDPRSTKDLM